MNRPTAFQGSSDIVAFSPTRFDGQSIVSRLPILTHRTPGYEMMVLGAPNLGEFKLETNSTTEHCDAILRAYEVDGKAAFGKLRGRFAIAILDREASNLTLVTDRFATVPICYAPFRNGYVFAESTNLLPAELRSSNNLSSQGIFNYLYFHVIPAPGSIYNGVKKLPPASYVTISDGQAKVQHYWMPTFIEHAPQRFDEQAQELRTILKESVSSMADRPNLGCFLSGGLDSSTVVGLLSESSEQTARAFTIGFDTPEYDETEFARAAAKHFNAESNEYRVQPADVLASILDISRTYDEPFGNSSAVPTLCCARFAAENGVDTLIAGDGGDEIFAGNARYAKQKIFEVYNRAPRFLRSIMFDPLATERWQSTRVPGLSKLASYVRQARVPLPDRLETYNYLHRFELASVFTADFLQQIDVAQPLELLRERYNEPGQASTLNRMLYLDWKITLADNDIRKVTAMCQLAGVHVEFPFLNEALVEFSTSVPSSRKLRGTYLRYFFRKSMQDFLPAKVLQKRKHGFGLPFGVWLIRDPELRRFAYASLDRLQQRNIIAPGFIDSLRTATEQDHAAYFGSMIWVLMILEEWLQAHHS